MRYRFLPGKMGKFLKSNNMPNLFVIGAMRAATTTLWRCLGQHPEIFMSSVKEPRYFATLVMNSEKMEIVRKHRLWGGTAFTEEEYLDLFKAADQEKVIGEASPLYMAYPEVAKKLFNANPSAKLLVSLRHPVDRAFSHFHHNRRMGFEPREDFYEAFYEDFRTNYAGYYRLGLYCSQLQPFFHVFPSHQIKVVLFENFLKDVNKQFMSIFDFLDVDPFFSPVMEKKSASKTIAPPQMRNCLTIPFMKDLSALSELLEMDFSVWTETNRLSVADGNDIMFSPWYYLTPFH